MTPKPKPEIIKLEFSKADQEYIDAMLEGRPTPKIIKEWSDRGLDIEHKTKRYTCPTFKDRIRTIQHKYKIGTCHVCQKIPVWRVLYKMEGVTLVEYWCQEHMDNQVSIE